MKKVQSWALAGFLTLVVAQPSLANTQCRAGIMAQMINTGFMLSSSKKRILESAQPMARNRGVTRAQMVERVEKHIRKYHNGLKNISVSGLANIIADASVASGVDFTVLSSLVRKESNYCEDRYNNSGGDSGCVQFTSPGLNELKHQFGIAGKGKYTPGVPDILNKLTDTYFAGKADRKAEFKRWLRLSTSDQKFLLRNRNYHDIDIFAGALLLKVYLANANGNYVQGLRQYNGSAKKVQYANNVNAVAQHVSFDNSDLNCQEAMQFPYDIYDISCEISEDDQCFIIDESFQDDLDRLHNVNWT